MVHTTDHWRTVAIGFVVTLALLSMGFSQGRGQQGSGGATPTIEDKTSGMQKIDGFFPLFWDLQAGQLWMEINRFDEEVLHSAGTAAGLGSNDIGLDRGAPTGSRIVKFQRIGPKILMVQPNYRFRASSSNQEEVRAVTDAFAPSVLWGFPGSSCHG